MLELLRRSAPQCEAVFGLFRVLIHIIPTYEVAKDPQNDIKMRSAYLSYPYICGKKVYLLNN